MHYYPSGECFAVIITACRDVGGKHHNKTYLDINIASGQACFQFWLTCKNILPVEPKYYSSCNIYIAIFWVATNLRMQLCLI
jgi:hypothetical protein